MRETEFGYINWIQKHLKYSPDVLVGSGDDAAVVQIGKDNQVCVTTDTIVENVDFHFKTASPEQIGHKSVAISISDLAAMGGGFSKIYAVIAVSMRKNQALTSFTRPLFNGINKICRKFGVQLIGGDISSTSGPLTITSTLFGVGRNINPVRRSGAKVGDVIMVTGKLGGSILGRHLNFTPRLKEAALLAKKYQINSMIDISDGLLADLNHILEASKVGALIDEVSIPISLDAFRVKSAIPVRPAGGRNPQSEIPAVSHALTDGEDFELLFTAPVNDAARIVNDKGLNYMPISIIGFIQKGKGITLYTKSGKYRRMESKGYTHF